jgi:hypothetical protein
VFLRASVPFVCAPLQPHPCGSRRTTGNSGNATPVETASKICLSKTADLLVGRPITLNLTRLGFGCPFWAFWEVENFSGMFRASPHPSRPGPARQACSRDKRLPGAPRAQCETLEQSGGSVHERAPLKPAPELATPPKRPDDPEKMTREQHKLAVELLRRLEVQNLRLEPGGRGRYKYYGWSEPLVGSNGSPAPAPRRGTIRGRGK